MGHEGVQFLEAAGVEEESKAFAGRELAPLVLLGKPFDSATLLALGPQFTELIELGDGLGSNCHGFV
jgi:hypothetical protein